MTANPRTLSRRRLLQLGGALGAAGLTSSALAACGASDSAGGSGGSATLRFMFWGADDRVKRFQEACALFTKKNPTIKVMPEFGAIDSIRTKTTVAMASKNLPDVMWILGDLLPQMASEGHIMDLTPHLGTAGGIAIDGFSAAVMEPGKQSGKQYAMTHGIQSVGVFARKSVLDEVGIPIKQYPEAYSWEEYTSYCAKIHQAKGEKFFGTDDPNYASAPNFFRAYARQNGQQMWTDSGDIGFTRELLTTWLEYWKQLRDSQAAVPTALALEQNPYFEGAPMIRGLSAFHMRNSNQMLELQQLSKDPLVLMPVPGNGGAGNANIALDPNMLSIAANTKNSEAALKFADFLLNDEDRAKIIGTTIGGPPTDRIRQVISPTVSAPEAQFLKYIGFEASAKAKPVPAALPTAGAFGTAMNKAIENLAYGKSTVAQTVDTVFGDLRTKLLAK
ncbi:MAG TPA: extracellular solute-binding protein [Kribbella sp.]|uniref:ABC transporter substrate-binding protein n=1 Tax=Kribbella sp. TaxID=1871183 RepID=UPI002D7835F2|nr:extracellular solute-binding protein [Kribbella sp.]HET6293959.1 extracellular solute-binding protein [Kribbella sp.]